MVGHTKNPKNCHYHIIISHPIKNYFILEDKIQALVKTGVLRLDGEKKKAARNIISLQFGKGLSR